MCQHFWETKCDNFIIGSEYVVNMTTDVPQPYNKIGDGPEGPEVRTIADKLKPVIVGTIMTKATKTARAKTLGFENLKCPCSVLDITSYGKKLIIILDNNVTIIFSLGMEGKLQYTPSDHTHVKFELHNKKIVGPFNVLEKSFMLYFHDHRYFGSVDVIPASGVQLYFSNIGPDLMQAALDEKTWISSDIWISRFSPKTYQNRIIAEVIKDQEVFAAIGNYLMAEILYYSGINPLRPVKTLTSEEWEKLRVVTHQILNLSYSLGGCTIASYISPDGEKGGYQCAVYGKKDGHDPQGYPVVSYKKTESDQAIYYCPKVQS